MPDPDREPPAAEEPEQPWWPADNDPRLKIPDELTKPVQKPASLQPKPPEPSQAMQMGRAWATALDFVFTVLAGAILGWLFDRWRHTAPTGALIGLGLGFVLAFFRIVRATQKQDREEQERKKRDRS